MFLVYHCIPRSNLCNHPCFFMLDQLLAFNAVFEIMISCLNCEIHLQSNICVIQKVSEYDQEIPHSHTGDQPMTPRERVTE